METHFFNTTHHTVGVKFCYTLTIVDPTDNIMTTTTLLVLWAV